MTVIKVIKINKKKIAFYLLGFIMLIFLAFMMRKIIHNPKPEVKTINEEEKSFVLEKGVNVDEEILDEEKLSKIPIGTELKNSQPTVLITHTHISEGYEGGGTVKDVGDELADILAKRYGITVVHDVNPYDQVDGKENIEGAYERMEASVLGILEKYPTIEVVIDIHRDSIVDDQKIVSYVNDEIMAALMMVNGVCSAENSPQNEFMMENLALSLKVYETANEFYPGLLRKNYIKPYRYSTHMKPLSMLIEVGFQNNTLEEALNSMEPLADTLVKAIESN